MTIFFATVYKVGGVEYSSFIHAKTRSDAQKIADRRNIHETILGTVNTNDCQGFDPQPLPSHYYMEAAFAHKDPTLRLKILIATSHLVTFYGWIASKARIVDPCAHFMSDQGMLHEVLHEMEFPSEYGFRLALYQNMQNLEECIPGLRTQKKTYSDQLIRTQVKYFNDIMAKRDDAPVKLEDQREAIVL